MSPFSWVLTGAGIWVFVALTIPLLGTAIFGRPTDADDLHALIGMSWGWPVMIPLITLIAIVYGIVTAVAWVGKGYVRVIMGTPEEAAEKPVEGKVMS